MSGGCLQESNDLAEPGSWLRRADMSVPAIANFQRMIWSAINEAQLVGGLVDISEIATFKTTSGEVDTLHSVIAAAGDIGARDFIGGLIRDILVLKWPQQGFAFDASDIVITQPYTLAACFQGKQYLVMVGIHRELEQAVGCDGLIVTVLACGNPSTCSSCDSCTVS
jgi:hypothetical protein